MTTSNHRHVLLAGKAQTDLALNENIPRININISLKVLTTYTNDRITLKSGVSNCDSERRHTKEGSLLVHYC